MMPFSRTWKVLKKGGFSNGDGKVFDFCLGKFYNILKWIHCSVSLNTIYVIFIHFTIYSSHVLT